MIKKKVIKSIDLIHNLKNKIKMRLISETTLTTQMINTQLLHEPVLTKVIGVWMPSINLL